MPDWRDRILKALTPGVARLTLAVDSDGLLLEAALLEAIRERGFEVVTFDDPVAFRFDYESRFRSRWDRDEGAGLEVIVRTEGHDRAALPCDLVQAGRRLSFGLDDLFPAFSYPVVASLDRSDLDALCRAQERHRPDRLGEDATRDFVLRHVFDFAAELVRRPSDLLRLLLRRHYRGQRLPRLLDDRLVQLLRQGGAFAAWPLEAILPDRDAFFAFLQERWPLFLDRLAGNAGNGGPQDAEGTPGFAIGGPADDPRCKVALLVVDGLALDQWLVLRDALAIQRPELRFREGAAFAWVPTITSVSRQAIFAGKPPFYFPSSLLTTDREASLWTRFWADRGLTVREAGYARGLGDGSPDGIRELLSRPKIRALGLVVDKVDKIMHGMTLGTAGMHNQVRQWAEEGFMAGLLDALLNDGFAVFLTSDHGNVEAEGCGRPAEGAIADVRGERARVYPDAALRSRVKERFPDAVEWPGPGLPEDCLALLAPGRTAFVREGERIVGHGGVSLEEVVVPMVQIGRAAA